MATPDGRSPSSRGRSDRIVLEIARRGRALVGSPLFFRGEQMPLARGRVRVAEGSIALCRVDSRGAQPIVELGRADRARDVVAALLAERGLRPTFPRRLEAEASDAAARVRNDPGPRTDLTAEPTFTVDPTTARDFDDAVSARREDDGFRLWVHIADVAAHVLPESGLDREARERANSTYAPGIVSPMLPRALSDEACSLVPGVERFARQNIDRLTLVGLGAKDDLAYAKQFVRTHAMTIKMLWDPSRESWDALGIRSQPSALLLSADGRILRKYIGPFDEADVLSRIA